MSHIVNLKVKLEYLQSKLFPIIPFLDEHRAKFSEVEGMTAVDFGVWKSGKHAEVRSFLDDEFDIVLLHFICRSVPTLREERRYPGGLFSAWLSWPTLTLPEN